MDLDQDQQLAVIADMLRYNMLTEVMAANTGHLGTSLSAAEVLAVLYHHTMKVDPDASKLEDRDVFILSKGHAAPALYAALASRGFFPDAKLSAFRRLGGLQGHVDMIVPGCDANTGSLAMGISKAKGHAWAMQKQKTGRRAFVMVGDGELQEGQNWEALQSAPAMGLGNLVLLLDQNMVQSDRLVEDLMPMPPIEDKLKAFGWKVSSVTDGNDVKQVRTALDGLDNAATVPQAIILKTVKGKGASFMEYPSALAKDGIYLWHNKVPNQEQYAQAAQEIQARLKRALAGANTAQDFWPQVPEQFTRVITEWKDDFVVRGYSRALLESISVKTKILALDGDLAVDCGIRKVEEQFPNNFIEVGIAEQDMVSMAGSLAFQGYLPFVNTFAAFLTARANEQIFNNCSEHTKVIYVGHLAGLIPATPGKSHQAVRDVGLVKTIPELAICEPCCEQEAYLMTKFVIEKLARPVYLRLANCKGLADIKLPESYDVALGRGCVLREGNGLALIASGPVMLAQALGAAELFKRSGKEAKVINLPWYRDIDAAWLAGALAGITTVAVIDNHVPEGGLGDELARLTEADARFVEKNLVRFAVHGFAETGQPAETLKRFGLDAESLFESLVGRV